MDDHTYEQWLPVLNTDGWYEVSDLGRIRTWRVKGRHSNVRSDEPRIMPLQRITSKRYFVVHLAPFRSARQPYVHHLVAEAFIGPRPDGQVVRHLNDDTSDNRAVNLAYGTMAQNYADAVANGSKTGSQPRPKCLHGHPFTEENTRYSTRANGRRTRNCRECDRLRSVARSVARAEARAVR